MGGHFFTIPNISTLKLLFFVFCNYIFTTTLFFKMKKLSIILFLFLSTIVSSQTWINYDLKELNIEYIDLYDLG